MTQHDEIEHHHDDNDAFQSELEEVLLPWIKQHPDTAVVVILQRPCGCVLSTSNLDNAVPLARDWVAFAEKLS